MSNVDGTGMDFSYVAGRACDARCKWRKGQPGLYYVAVRARAGGGRWVVIYLDGPHANELDALGRFDEATRLSEPALVGTLIVGVQFGIIRLASRARRPPVGVLKDLMAAAGGGG